MEHDLFPKMSLDMDLTVGAYVNKIPWIDLFHNNFSPSG